MKKAFASAVEVATKEANAKALDEQTQDDRQIYQIAEVLLGYNKGGKGNGTANEAAMDMALKLRAIVKTIKVTVDLG